MACREFNLKKFPRNSEILGAATDKEKEKLSRYGIADGEPIGNNIFRVKRIVEKHDGKIRITSFAKNIYNDNLPTLMEVCSELFKEGFDFELYLHTNVYDKAGEYDLFLLKNRFDRTCRVYPDQWRGAEFLSAQGDGTEAENLPGDSIHRAFYLGLSIYDLIRHI
jgi:UDP-N-acetylglucosamine pyrophosphorylase